MFTGKKQTEYEMRISERRSDVCSSDLPDRAASNQTRNQSQRGDGRTAAKPGLELDLRARVAIDLPRQIIDPAGIGQAGIGEPRDAEQLALQPPARPAARACPGRDCGNGGRAEPFVTRRIGIDARLPAAGAFGDRKSTRLNPSP